jgi:hypothetical protein
MPKTRFQASSGVAMRLRDVPSSAKLMSDGVSPPTGCMPKLSDENRLSPTTCLAIT